MASRSILSGLPLRRDVADDGKAFWAIILAITSAVFVTSSVGAGGRLGR